MNVDTTNVEVKNFLSMAEVGMCVQYIVFGVLDIVDGHYYPFMTEYIMRKRIIMAYSNFKFPDDEDEVHEILMHSNLYDYVLENADTEQTSIIMDSAIEMIEFEKQKVLHASKFDDFMGTLTTLFENLSKNFDGIDMEKMMEALKGKEINTDKLVKSVASAVSKKPKKETKKEEEPHDEQNV